MSNQVVGYIRVSSQSQSVLRQLCDIYLDKKFIDVITGSTKERPKLKECMAYVREGDVLVVDSIDRLARNLQHLQEILNEMLQKGVTVRFVKENLQFKSENDHLSMLMLQMMGAFAQFERTMIKSRQREGINAAKKAGKHLGRPHKIDDKFRHAVKDKLDNSQSIRSIAKDMNVSRTTIYKVIEQLKGLNNE